MVKFRIFLGHTIDLYKIMKKWKLDKHLRKVRIYTGKCKIYEIFYIKNLLGKEGIIKKKSPR